MKTKKVIIATIVGALILFVWNAVSWMVLPFHGNALMTVPEQALVPGTLQQNMPEDGVYHYPGLPETNTPEVRNAIQEKLKTGPRITLMVYKHGGTSIFSPGAFLTSLLFNLVTVLLLLLIITRIQNRDAKNIIFMTVTIGILISFARDFPQMVWYLFPLRFTIIEVFDTIFSFFLLGLFLGYYLLKQIDYEKIN